MTDRQALDRFLASVERRAYRVAQLACGHPDDALDIVQDAMTRFVHHYAGKAATDWPPLFYRVLDSRIRDHQRREAVRRRWRRWLGREPHQTEDDHTAPANPLETLPDPRAAEGAQALQSARNLALIEQVLRKLPARQRQAFILRCWEGLDTAATATAMQCSTGSVKTHYARALARLRQALAAADAR